MTSSSIGTAQDETAAGTVTALRSVPTEPSGAPTDLLHKAIDGHSTALGRHLDTYLAAVAHELRDHGVLTGSPQRTDPAHRLIGSIVLDCTALRLAAWTPTDQLPADQQSLADALHPERPAPVVVTWDEHTGWCVGLHDDPTHSSRRYLHPELLARPSAVAEFVVGLALGQQLGSVRPITGTAAGRTAASHSMSDPVGATPVQPATDLKPGPQSERAGRPGSQ